MSIGRGYKLVAGEWSHLDTAHGNNVIINNLSDASLIVHVGVTAPDAHGFIVPAKGALHIHKETDDGVHVRTKNTNTQNAEFYAMVSAKPSVNVTRGAEWH